MTLTRRDYCRCTSVRNFGYEQAASKLGCVRRWLEDNISNLPHQKFGQSPVFCDCELALIQEMHTVLPAGVLDALQADDGQRTVQELKGVLALASISPSQGRRSRTASR